MGKIEIIQQHNLLNNLTINRLKYLFYRNRGMLRLRELLEICEKKFDNSNSGDVSNSSNDQSSIYNEIIGSINDLLNANLFGDPDTKLIHILSSLFEHFGYTRLARLCYELKVSNSKNLDNDDLRINLGKPDELLDKQVQLLNNYLCLLKKTGDTDSKIYQNVEKCLDACNKKIIKAKAKYNWNNILSIEDWEKERKSNIEGLIIDVDIDHDGEIDLSSFFESLVDTLPSSTGKNRVYDGYLLTKMMVEQIKIEFGTESKSDNDVSITDVDNNEDQEDNDNDNDNDNNSDNNNNTDTKENNIESELHKEGNIEIKQEPDCMDVDKTIHENENDKDKDKNNVNKGNTNNIEIQTLQKSDDSLNETKEESKIKATEEIISDTLENPQKNIVTPLAESSTGTHTSKINSSSLRSTRSSRGRPETETVEEVVETFYNYDLFISQTLPAFLKLCDLSIKFEPLNDLLSDNDTNNNELNDKYDIRINSFYSCLSNWNDEYTQCLTTHESKSLKKNNSVESIRDILSIKPNKNIILNGDNKLNTAELYQYLLEISKKNVHFNHLRSKVLEFMFNCDLSVCISYINFQKMSQKTIKKFKQVVDTVCLSFFKQFQHTMLYDEQNDLQLSNIMISIYELFVESYLKFLNEKKLKKGFSKNSEFQLSEQIICKQINTWEEILEDYFSITEISTIEMKNLHSRFIWIKVNYLQVSSSDNLNMDTLTNDLSQLLKVVSETKISIPYINYENIQALNCENVQNQYSKLKMLEIFDKSEDSNEILENVLFNKLKNYSVDEKFTIQKQFQEFVEHSNLALKLKVWSLLLRYYQINQNSEKYRTAYERILNLLSNEITDEKITNLSEKERSMKILDILGFFIFFSKKYVEFLSTVNFKCFDKLIGNPSDHKMTVQNLSNFLYIFYLYIMQNKTLQSDNKANESLKSGKSNQVLNDGVFCCFTLLAIYYPLILKETKDEYVVDFLSVVHAELGVFKQCAGLGGIFLKYIQHKLFDMNVNLVFRDLFQCIHCRYSLPVSVDGYETSNHKCHPAKMTMYDAVELSKFISNYCFQKKNTVNSAPKSDIKAIVDKIIDVVGELKLSEPILKKNDRILKQYLFNSSIDFQFITQIFKGNYTLNFTTPDISALPVAQNGLFFIEGLNGLNYFKFRKKTMQSRIAELDYVVQMFTNDIICNCNRFESWVSLGQAFTFLVEDDLLWTADKLNSVERKQMIAMTQKKSLLSYFMAINIYFKMTEDERKSNELVAGTLWKSFSKDLYSSWVEPMNKKLFHVFIDENELFDDLKSRFPTLYLKNNDIPQNFVIKLMELAFTESVKFDPTSWYDLVYLGKTKLKLQNAKIDHLKIIEHFVEACNIALKQSNKDDPIIEPHYYLFTNIFKFYANSKITFEEAIEHLKKNELFASSISKLNEPITNMKDLTFFILQRIISYDKKNWQHRPIFRLAQSYYFMNNDIAKAKLEMSKIINIKPNVRSLGTIWKPSSELPGKHFLYNSKYTFFLSRLLYESGDIYLLSVLIKKLRKATSIMVNITKTFDNSILRLCTLIRKALRFGPGYLDEHISKIKYSDFTKYSKEYTQYLKNKDIKDYDEDTKIQLYLLSETHSFKKMATGFGATGTIDDCYYSIFIKLFIPFLLKRLIEEKCQGLTLKDLFRKAKMAQNDISRTRGDTPGITDVDIDRDESILCSKEDDVDNSNNVTNNIEIDKILNKENDETEGKINFDDVDKLSYDTKLLIINYLSLLINENISNTPSKEKVKVARRDISPFSAQIVVLVDPVITLYKQETDDGEKIDFKLAKDLSNEEFEEISSNVISKETKENKEEKDYETFIAKHSRSCDDEELCLLNEILQKYNVTPLERSDSNEKSIVTSKKLDLDAIKNFALNGNTLTKQNPIIEIKSEFESSKENNIEVPKRINSNILDADTDMENAVTIYNMAAEKTENIQLLNFEIKDKSKPLQNNKDFDDENNPFRSPTKSKEKMLQSSQDMRKIKLLVEEPKTDISSEKEIEKENIVDLIIDENTHANNEKHNASRELPLRNKTSNEGYLRKQNNISHIKESVVIELGSEVSSEANSEIEEQSNKKEEYKIEVTKVETSSPKVDKNKEKTPSKTQTTITSFFKTTPKTDSKTSTSHIESPTKAQGKTKKEPNTKRGRKRSVDNDPLVLSKRARKVTNLRKKKHDIELFDAALTTDSNKKNDRKLRKKSIETKANADSLSDADIIVID